MWWRHLNTLDLVANLPQLAHLVAGPLPEPKTAPKQQNEVGLVSTQLLFWARSCFGQLFQVFN